MPQLPNEPPNVWLCNTCDAPIADVPGELCEWTESPVDWDTSCVVFDHAASIETEDELEEEELVSGNYALHRALLCACCGSQIDGVQLVEALEPHNAHCAGRCWVSVSCIHPEAADEGLEGGSGQYRHSQHVAVLSCR